MIIQDFIDGIQMAFILIRSLYNVFFPNNLILTGWLALIWMICLITILPIIIIISIYYEEYHKKK